MSGHSSFATNTLIWTAQIPFGCRPTIPLLFRISIYLLKIDLHSHPSIYSIYIQNPTFPQYLLNTGFIHFFVEQNQGLFKDFPGQKLQFSSTFFWAFSYIKPCLNLPFFKWKCLYPAQALVSGNIVSRYIFLPEKSACGTESGKWWMSNVSGRKCQNFCCSFVLYEYLGYFRVGENFFFLSDIGSDRNWGSVCLCVCPTIFL